MGDFDATIRFTLSTWPEGDNVSLALNTNLGNTWVDSAPGGDVFGLFVFPSGGGGTVGAVRSGDLRLSRRGDVISSYVRSGHEGNWVQIGQSAGSAAPTWIDLAMWNVANFGGLPVSVQIESFQLDAAGLSC